MGMIKEIPQPEIPPYQDAVYKGDTRVRSLRELKIGGGENILKVNTDGLFMGADNFADAPFSVDYDGKLTATTGTFSGDTDWANVQTGTNENALNIGSGNVVIDGANKRIIINDGTDDRVLIGYDSGGF
jgi:hypothetical protein